MHLSGNIAKLTAFNRKNREVNGGEPKKPAFLALNWRNSGSNGVEPEKRLPQQR